jgi:hypothetical protein
MLHHHLVRILLCCVWVPVSLILYLFARSERKSLQAVVGWGWACSIALTAAAGGCLIFDHTRLASVLGTNGAGLFAISSWLRYRYFGEPPGYSQFRERRKRKSSSNGESPVGRLPADKWQP